MISTLATTISSFFSEKGIINKEELDVYSYSFEVLIASVWNGILLFTYALLAGRFVETICFALVFTTLRPFCGGYHALNHFFCCASMMFLYTIYLMLLKFTSADWYLIMTLANMTIGIITVFALAPLEDKNKPLDELEIKKYRKKSRGYTIIFSILIIISTFIWKANIYLYSMSIGLFFVALLLIISSANARLLNSRKES